MKPPLEILKNKFGNSFVGLDEIQYSMVVECMIEYAMQEVKNLNLPIVSNSKAELSCATCEYGKFTTHKVCTTCFARDKHVPAT